MSCEHLDFEARVNVIRLTATVGDDPHAFLAEVRVVCLACRVPFGWKGLPIGSTPDFPTCSADGLELRAPLLSPTELLLGREVSDA